LELDRKYEDAYLFLSNIYVEEERYEDAVRELEEAIKLLPDSESLYALLGYIYQEYLNSYPEAYKMYERVFDLNKSSVRHKQNFAEASLTTERFEQALYLVKDILRDKNLSSEGRLSMKLIEISSLLFQGKNTEALTGIKWFIEYYKSITEDYKRSWKYNSIKNFVSKNDKIGQSEKTLVLRLIDILESPKSEADEKLKKLESSLQGIFEPWQKGT